MTIKFSFTRKETLAALKVFFAASFVIVAVGCVPHGPREVKQGKRLIERGKYPEAVAKLRSATEILTTNAQVWNYFGLACHYAGQIAEAERAYQRAVALDHELSEAHFNLGCLYLEQNRASAARNELTSYVLGRGSSLEGLLILGLAQLRSREPVAAEKTFTEALRLNPQSLEALNGMGLASVQRGKMDVAISFFRTALKAQPNYSPALLNSAVVSQAYQKDPRGALEKYRQYLLLQPSPPDVASVKNHVLQLESELNPPPAPPVPQLTKSVAPPLTNVDQSKTNAVGIPQTISATPAAAKQLADSTGPPTGRYSYRRGWKPVLGDTVSAQRFFAQGLEAQRAMRIPDAISAYRSAIRADPAFFNAYFNLGVSETAAGDLPAALAAYESAVQLRPESPDARYNFALLLEKSKYPYDAADELETMLSRSPNDARAHLALGNLYNEQLRDPAKARPHYQRFLDLDPQNPQAGTIRYWLGARSGR